MKLSSEMSSSCKVVDSSLFTVVEPNTIDFVEFSETKVESGDEEFNFIWFCKVAIACGHEGSSPVSNDVPKSYVVVDEVRVGGMECKLHEGEERSPFDGKVFVRFLIRSFDTTAITIQRKFWMYWSMRDIGRQETISKRKGRCGMGRGRLVSGG